MVKLLIVSFHFYPDLCAGSFRSKALVDALQRVAGKDISIDIITTLPNRYSTYAVDAPEVEEIGNVKIKRIMLPKHKSGMIDQAMAFSYFSYVARKHIVGKHYDLVYATSSRLMAAVLGSWLAKCCKAKLYLDIRDIFVETIEDVFPKKLANFAGPVFSIIEKLSFNRADHINIVSKGFISYFTKRYPKKSLSYYTNGIDDEFLAAKKFDKPARAEQKIRVLYAGNIGEGQGLHNIIPSLAAKLPDYKFHIIGDGGRRKKLQVDIDRYAVSNVRLLDPCSREELIKSYQSADILFLHLNNYAAFDRVLPSKIFEYAALGKPILAGVGGYAAKFLREEVQGCEVFEPCDVTGALQAIQRLGLDNVERTDFVKKYSRRNIMDDMAKEILEMT